MSIRLPPPTTSPSQQTDDLTGDSTSSSDSDIADDQEWDDWISDSNAQQRCKSLFDDKLFPSIQEAATYDKENYNFVLDDVCNALSLDFHGRVRLINYIRKNKTNPEQILSLNGSEPWFITEEYLIPVLENDPLIQAPSDDWIDTEDEDLSLTDPSQRINALVKKLASERQNFADYRAMIAKKMDLEWNLSDIRNESVTKPIRDDDTHYFESYAANDIHAVMIQDKVRTTTYANFILTTPDLFRDAIVLDVGCGTGVLSLFAARAGAQKVIAVDASQITNKAEKIVKANRFENVITVVRGTIEEVSLPEGIEQVDIIISEWMGYALLYESMLDSVLVARDRFLRPGGVIAPSQCRMMLGLCDAAEVWKERIGFWDDIYGFDLSAMSEDLYDEAIADVVGPETILCKPFVVKDLILSDISSRELDFSTTFTLTSTAERRTKVSAFVLYFDTFFTASGHPVPPSTQVDIVKEHGIALAELWPVGGKPAQQRRQSLGKEKVKITSFSTGPLSSPTHWKQTLFMLRVPFMVSEGSMVIGRFCCKKGETNTRELDVEIHYSLQENAESLPGDTIVQIFKVR